MFYVQIGADGRPVRWSTSPFIEATEVAPAGTDFEKVYFRLGQMLILPTSIGEWAAFDPVAGTWMDTRTDDAIRVFRAAEIRVERDRRLNDDFEFQGVLYQRDQVSLARITGAATLAGFAMGAGAQPGNFRWHGGSTDFAWIASGNSTTTMDAQTCFAFGQAAAAVETGIVFAAKALREMDPIPEDITNPALWP